MLVRTNIVKGTDDATDFESNGQPNAVKIERIVFNGVVFLKTEDYASFKSRIDGNVITWADIKYIEGKHNYELWLEVN